MSGNHPIYSTPSVPMRGRGFGMRGNGGGGGGGNGGMGIDILAGVNAQDTQGQGKQMVSRGST
jgi:hypothetical protein